MAVSPASVSTRLCEPVKGSVPVAWVAEAATAGCRASPSMVVSLAGAVSGREVGATVVGTVVVGATVDDGASGVVVDVVEVVVVAVVVVVVVGPGNVVVGPGNVVVGPGNVVVGPGNVVVGPGNVVVVVDVVVVGPHEAISTSTVDDVDGRVTPLGR
jgi:hypothetical protein